MPEAVNARSGQCPKQSMPEAVNAGSGSKRARKKSFALEGKNYARSGEWPKRSMPEAVPSV